MRRLALSLLLAPLFLKADPATLHVELKDNAFLSFRLENRYESPVTKFQVAADFGEHHELGCGMTVEVKRPEDLHPPGTCSLPVEPGTGKVVNMKWKTRLVFVEFADGMRWTPKQ